MTLVYNNLATHYSYKKEWEQAFIYLEKTLKLKQQSYERNHPEIANSYISLGTYYIDTEVYTEAIKEHFKRRLLYLNKLRYSLEYLRTPFS